MQNVLEKELFSPYPHRLLLGSLIE